MLYGITDNRNVGKRLPRGLVVADYDYVIHNYTSISLKLFFEHWTWICCLQTHSSDLPTGAETYETMSLIYTLILLCLIWLWWQVSTDSKPLLWFPKVENESKAEKGEHQSNSSQQVHQHSEWDCYNNCLFLCSSIMRDALCVQKRKLL